MKRSLISCVAVCVMGVNACMGAIMTTTGFEGDYAPANWSLNQNGGDGSVYTALAPASIAVTGSDSGVFTDTGVVTSYEYTFGGSGSDSAVVSFSWSYVTTDTDASAEFDPAGYVLDGVTTQLTVDSGGVAQSGVVTGLVVTAEQSFGFYVDAVDDVFGNATITISDFVVSSGQIPEPASTALVLAAGALGLIAYRRRRA